MGIPRIAGLIVRAITKGEGDLSGEVRVSEAKREIDNLLRRNREYFNVIESMETQRDEWKQLYFTQSAQHQVAQEMLQRRALQIGEQLVKVLRHLNYFLKEGGHDLVESPKSLDELSDDVAGRYGERMKELADKIGEDIDGDAERKQIAASPSDPS